MSDVTFVPNITPITAEWLNDVNLDVKGVGNIAYAKVRGFVGDYNGVTGTDNTPALLALLADTTISKIEGFPGNFWFSRIVGDTAMAVVTRELEIDWKGAKLFTGETNPTVANVSTTFIQVKDIGNFTMKNYEFTDTTFSYSNASRGVQPVSILNTGTNVTYGYNLGPFYVHAGQSLVTAFSTNVGVAIAKQITFVGSCRGGTVYYGVNLASSGDQATLQYTVENAYRALFVYGVEDVDAVFHCKDAQASSANLLISALGTRPTRNIKVRATFDTVNGGIFIDGTSGASAELSNIDLDVYGKTAGPSAGTGTSMVRLGAMDTGGNWVASDTITLKNIKVRARSNYKYDLGMVAVMTTGANISGVFVDIENLAAYYSSGGYKNAGVHFRRDRTTIIGGTGSLQTTPVKIDLTKIIPLGPTYIFGILRVTSLVTQSSMTMKEYRIAGFYGSDGTHSATGFSATQVSSVQVGAYNPTITVTADGLNYVVAASAGGDASAITILSFELADGL